MALFCGFVFVVFFLCNLRAWTPGVFFRLGEVRGTCVSTWACACVVYSCVFVHGCAPVCGCVCTHVCLHVRSCLRAHECLCLCAYVCRGTCVHICLLDVHSIPLACALCTCRCVHVCVWCTRVSMHVPACVCWKQQDLLAFVCCPSLLLLVQFTLQDSAQRPGPREGAHREARAARGPPQGSPSSVRPLSLCGHQGVTTSPLCSHLLGVQVWVLVNRLPD